MAHGHSEAAERIVGFAISPDKVCTIQVTRDRLAQCCIADVKQGVLLDTGQEALETRAPDKSSGSEHHHSRHRPVKTCDRARALRPNTAEMPGRRCVTDPDLHAASQAAQSRTFMIPPSAQTAQYVPS